MTLLQAALIFAARLVGNQPHDQVVMEDTVIAIVEVTDNIQEVETLIKIARYESGGFRIDIADCRTRGDFGAAQGIFQVHPFNKDEMTATCSKDYRDQVRVALIHMHDSVAICKMHGYKNSDLLGQYTCGHCYKNNESAYLRWGSGKELQTLVYTEINQDMHKHQELFRVEVEE